MSLFEKLLARAPFVPPGAVSLYAGNSQDAYKALQEVTELNKLPYMQNVGELNTFVASLSAGQEERVSLLCQFRLAKEDLTHEVLRGAAPVAKREFNQPGVGSSAFNHHTRRPAGNKEAVTRNMWEVVDMNGDTVVFHTEFVPHSARSSYIPDHTYRIVATVAKGEQKIPFFQIQRAFPRGEISATR